MALFYVLLGALSVAVALHALAHLLLLISSPVPKPARDDETAFVDRDGQTRPFPSLLDPASVGLSVIVPAYNEEERLPSMLKDAYAYLSSQKRSYEIIVVSDGSTDGTAAVARDFAKAHPDCDLRVLNLVRNRGKGGAVTQGFLKARGEHILFADADGATAFDDIDRLFAALRQDPHAMAIGSRAHLMKSEVKRSGLRVLLMKCFHIYLWVFGIRGLKDTQCGFKLLPRLLAQRIIPNMHVEGWIFDIELLLLASLCGHAILEVPVRWQEMAGSKINLVADSIRMARDLLIIRGNYMLGRWRVPPPVLKQD